ncbi:hypothetical protein [Aestuariivirga litoralis]|nr:hypothetical protein [Aestuariivirga litoralis]
MITLLIPWAGLLIAFALVTGFADKTQFFLRSAFCAFLIAAPVIFLFTDALSVTASPASIFAMMNALLWSFLLIFGAVCGGLAKLVWLAMRQRPGRRGGLLGALFLIGFLALEFAILMAIYPDFLFYLRRMLGLGL